MGSSCPLFAPLADFPHPSPHLNILVKTLVCDNLWKLLSITQYKVVPIFTSIKQTAAIEQYNSKTEKMDHAGLRANLHVGPYWFFLQFVFYQIVMTKNIHKGKETSQPTCRSYAIVKVPYTNVFVVVTEGPECFINRASCPCHDICTSNKSNACECPCKGRLEYNFCNASLTGER